MHLSRARAAGGRRRGGAVDVGARARTTVVARVAVVDGTALVAIVGDGRRRLALVARLRRRSLGRGRGWGSAALLERDSQSFSG